MRDLCDDMYLVISIHALLAESDHAPNHNPCLHSNFYPRSPCGERLSALWMALSRLLFLSTLSLRRATIMFVRCSCSSRFLSTLSLRRATRGEIHANSQQEFLSTLSLRRATINVYHRIFGEGISIHALLAESDCQWRRSIKLFRQFLSTLSLRRATDQNWASSSGPLFLSTLSLRRATRNRFAVVDVLPISIHALLAESDAMPPATAPTAVYFYPRSPCGERPSRGRNRKN